jgi:two-component system chemotaxis sensor kinase CheA
VPAQSENQAVPALAARVRLRTKLIRAMVGTLAVVFGATLLIVGYLNYRSSRSTLDTIETQIRQSITRKGQGLATNHALALRPLVADNAFGDVARLVQRAVHQDDEMVYGLFLGADGRPWAYVRSGDDSATAPAHGDWQELQISPGEGRTGGARATRRQVFGEKVFEFSAPVDADDGAILGRIFYGLSSVPLDRALSVARRDSQRSLFLTLFALGVLGAAAMLLGVGIIRNLSQRITRPLVHLTEVTTAIAAGAKNERVSISSDDEIGDLGNAFNRMVEQLDDSYERLEQRVVERTEELAQRNRDMRLVLDNVNQGFLTISRAGMLAQERSAIVDRWFGGYQGQIAFWTYVAPYDHNFSELFELGYEALLEGTLPLQLCVEQLPKRMRVAERELSFTYHAMHEEGAFTGLLIVVNDITEQLLHARQEAEQAEVLAMFRAFSHDRTGFLAFFDEGSRMLESLQAGGADLIARKRLYHTLKGNAALTGFHAVAELCHRAEDQLAEGDEAAVAATLDALLARWRTLRETLAALIGERGRDVVEVHGGELEATLEELRGAAAPARILSRLSAWRLEPAEKSLSRLGHHARVLAQRLGKGELEVAIESGGVRLDPQRFMGLWSELVHVVRNAVDHGLETPDERRARGKSPRPRLQLRTRVDADQLVIEIEDDGQGIGWQAVRRAAAASGLPTETAEDLTNALLAPGVTTRAAVTATSGRGMGLAAVRDRVESLGGRIMITSAQSRGTKFEIRMPLAPVQKERRSPPLKVARTSADV